MPVLTNCPHCTFPTLVRAQSRGKARLCKQCGHGFVVSRKENRIRRLEARTNAELLELVAQHRRPKVWILDT